MGVDEEEVAVVEVKAMEDQATTRVAVVDMVVVITKMVVVKIIVKVMAVAKVIIKEVMVADMITAKVMVVDTVAKVEMQISKEVTGTEKEWPDCLKSSIIIILPGLSLINRIDGGLYSHIMRPS